MILPYITLAINEFYRKLMLNKQREITGHPAKFYSDSITTKLYIDKNI